MVTPVEVSKDLTQVTRLGDNSEPSFSPDSTKLVFVSRNRNQHSYGQIYELHLDNQKEQRLTFQGAENASPQYIRNGKWLLYSSATDETKENPKQLLLDNAEANFQAFPGPDLYSNPMDLYLHNLTAFNIIRLTSTPGFDGRPFWEPKFENIVFTRRRGAQTYLFSVQTRRPLILKPFSNTPNSSDWIQSQDRSIQLWVEWSKDFTSSELKVKTPTGLITLLPDFPRIKRDPSFVPGSTTIIFSMNHPNEKFFNIFSIQADGTCLTQWTSSESLNFSPKVAPDLKNFAFSSNRSGQFQIYLKAWPQTIPCGSGLNPVKSQ